MTRKNHDNHLKRPIGSYSEILNEYRSLALRPELTEIEAKRLEHILEAACSDDMLSLLLNEVDEALFDAQEHSEHHNHHEIQNEAARTVELIGGEIPCHKKVFANAKLNLAAYEPTLKEYRNLLQAPTLSEADAIRMEQILETAYDDELLTLLLNAIDERLEGKPRITQPKQPRFVGIVPPSRKSIGPRRKRSATSVIQSGLIACSLILAAAPLAMNLQPQTSPQKEQLTSSNDSFMNRQLESDFNNSNSSPGEEEALAEITLQSSPDNDVPKEEIIDPKVIDNSLNADIGDSLSPMLEFEAEAIEPGPRENLTPQKATTELEIIREDIEHDSIIPSYNEPAMEDIEHDSVIPSYDEPAMETDEDENDEEVLDNNQNKSVSPDTSNEGQESSDIPFDFNDPPNSNQKIEIAGEPPLPEASPNRNYYQWGIAPLNATLPPHDFITSNSGEPVEDESVDRTANVIPTNNHSIAPIYGISELGADETVIVASGGGHITFNTLEDILATSSGVTGDVSISTSGTFQRSYRLPAENVAIDEATLDALGIDEPPENRDSENNNRYIVAVVKSPRNLVQLQQVFNNAAINSTRGEYINIGNYSSLFGAIERMNEAQRLGFDAQILPGQGLRPIPNATTTTGIR